MVIQSVVSTAHESRSLQISERFCLTSSLIPDSDCNSTSSVDFSPIICLRFIKTLLIVLMDIETSCKGHCEKLSHFLDLATHTVVGFLVNFKYYIQVAPVLYTPVTCYYTSPQQKESAFFIIQPTVDISNINISAKGITLTYYIFDQNFSSCYLKV